MYVSLTGDVVHHIPDVLLPAAADEVLLRSSVLQEHRGERLQSQKRRIIDYCDKEIMLFVYYVKTTEQISSKLAGTIPRKDSNEQIQKYVITF